MHQRVEPLTAARTILAAMILAVAGILSALSASSAQAPEPYLVVLDAGHGGRDGGATGRLGTSEKVVVLDFALRLRDALEDAKGIEVLMTRSDDSSVRLDDRVTFGRMKRADLFVSIHADSIRNAGVRGASIYTLADEASDEVAASLAEGEARSDILAGFEAPADRPVVGDILLDLMRRETEAFSHAFAERAVQTLRGQVRMLRNPHRYADFRVLRAPEVPSVLIELGYLSNRADERLLRDPEWLESTAGALANAIVEHARSVRGPVGGTPAN